MKEVEIYIKGVYIPREDKMCINVLIKSERKEVSRYFEINEKGSAIQAEYIGLIKVISSLKVRLAKKGLTFLKIFTINESMVKQLTGEYRVNSPKIVPLYSELKKLLSGFNYQVIWLNRSEMDGKIKHSSEIYDEKQLKELLDKIDFDEEDIWI